MKLKTFEEWWLAREQDCQTESRRVWFGPHSVTCREEDARELYEQIVEPPPTELELRRLKLDNLELTRALATCRESLRKETEEYETPPPSGETPKAADPS